MQQTWKHRFAGIALLGFFVLGGGALGLGYSKAGATVTTTTQDVEIKMGNTTVAIEHPFKRGDGAECTAIIGGDGQSTITCGEVAAAR